MRPGSARGSAQTCHKQESGAVPATVRDNFNAEKQSGGDAERYYFGRARHRPGRLGAGLVFSRDVRKGRKVLVGTRPRRVRGPHFGGRFVETSLPDARGAKRGGNVGIEARSAYAKPPCLFPLRACLSPRAEFHFPARSSSRPYRADKDWSHPITSPCQTTQTMVWLDFCAFFWYYSHS